MFDYKVATIILAVVTGFAIVLIILLIRYFIFRQRTASQYSMLFLLLFIIALHASPVS